MMLDPIDNTHEESTEAATEDAAFIDSTDEDITEDEPSTPPGETVWAVRLTQTAKRMLREITDRRIAGKLAETIDKLKYAPDMQGKPLISNLIGYRSVRAVGQRYRVIYTIEEHIVTVFVVAVGIRKEGGRDDVYALARKLLRRGLLEPTKEDQEDAKNDAAEDE